jgi:hypothetical protein
MAIIVVSVFFIVFNLFIKVSVVNKNHKNPSSDVFALRASVPMSWLCACEQAPTQALTSSHVASQLKTPPEEKHRSASLHWKTAHGKISF